MGYTVASMIAEAELSLEKKLEWHLTGNHEPAIDPSFIPAAMTAIYMANNENWDVLIEMPNGLQRSVRFIVEGMHLEPFVPSMTIPEEE